MIQCSHLKELLEDEIPFLKKEFKKHKNFLEKKLKRNVSEKEAEIDYISNDAKIYLTGFKDCYCMYVCPDRKKCEIHKQYRIVDFKDTRR